MMDVSAHVLMSACFSAVNAALAVAPSHPEALAFASKVRTGTDLHNFDIDELDAEARVEAGKRTPRTISKEQQRIQETKEKARRAMSEHAKRNQKNKLEEEVRRAGVQLGVAMHCCCAMSIARVHVMSCDATRWDAM